MNRSFHLLACLVILIAVAAIYQLKHMVESEQHHLQAMRQQYVEDRKAIRVLRAEWAYVNSPEYLAKLASQHLDLKPLRPTQVASGVDALPIQSEGLGRLAGLGDHVKPLKPEAMEGLTPFWSKVVEGGQNP